MFEQVRSEIQTREQEQEEEMERLVSAPVEAVQEKKKEEVVVVVSFHINTLNSLFTEGAYYWWGGDRKYALKWK